MSIEEDIASQRHHVGTRIARYLSILQTRRVACAAMHVWSGVMIAAAALLVVSGSAEAASARAQPSLRSAPSVRSGWARSTVRGLAVAEIVAGAVAVVVGGRRADAAVALLYRGSRSSWCGHFGTPAASCGCTARDDTPPTVGHLLMTVVFTAGAAAAVVGGGRTGLDRA